MNAVVNPVRPTPPETTTMIPIRPKRSDLSNKAEDATHYILGGAHVGIAIAEQLQDAGRRVAVVDDSYESNDIPGFTGDPATIEVLTQSGLDTASTVIIATPTDRRNLLIAQLVRARFDVPRIIALVHNPDRAPLFANAGHEPFCVTTAMTATLEETV